MTEANLVGMTIAVLGGTGPQGRGLARRFASAGLRVILGSRDADRATTVASMLEGEVSGATNADAAAAAEVVLVVVPWEGHHTLLQELRGALVGKVVIDCVNPLGFDKQGPYYLDVKEGSATEQAAALLPASRVVGGFHSLSAVLLDDPEIKSLDTDVLIVGDDRAATDLAAALAEAIPGVRGVYAGRLRNARQIEGLTANLISINRRYKAHSGIRVTDI